MSNSDLSQKPVDVCSEIERIARLINKAHSQVQFVLEPLLRELEASGVKLGVEFIQSPTAETGEKGPPCYKIKLDHPNYRLHSFIHPT